MAARLRVVPFLVEAVEEDDVLLLRCQLCLGTGRTQDARKSADLINLDNPSRAQMKAMSSAIVAEAWVRTGKSKEALRSVEARILAVISASIGPSTDLWWSCHTRRSSESLSSFLIVSQTSLPSGSALLDGGLTAFPSGLSTIRTRAVSI